MRGVIQNALNTINAYLDEKLFIFRPILDFLAEADGPSIYNGIE